MQSTSTDLRLAFEAGKVEVVVIEEILSSTFYDYSF